MNSIKYFNGIASKWNVIRSEYFEERLKYKVLSKADIKNKIVADLGCGTGFISLELANEAKLVFSIDNSVNMLKELKKSSINKNFNNVYPLKSSLEDITLFDESLDAIFINMALHHIRNADKAIGEMSRILKKGGVIVISDVMEHNGEWAREEMFDEWLGFSNSQISEWLIKSNFKNIHIENTDLTCKGYSSKGEYTETGIFIASAIKS
ncbi:methylase involved in ubiquinone/menaquinone biosynthesis [Clostridium pasteurianum DSM 525 = ATCC 6013]|uniref:Methylase involved in ubiquinone/menaquinone biosynthesis n=1 Tax=Clostridium pasteurianum DSM 525 = ATCC 6013 TaxID=1262449 RepID=A0A0H3J5P4_CLOPA|nr:class I SAM-dependent methyltransferase [Clostridium pasteurianum]AJA49326.1 methylase involved in ubiquinone/menaquinone biosynthesis [Clostridium pasteurianum DSM 525 = ATCC 6013]AJA53314.1 methylase involved in ubiquinone/menaquinone biosynthesis [Clostridium pasteurianum DSM 525 = ATCC 6013]AOZ76502.1 SAM-dependent methyltransferase [Clostridium pasteurianum DSM 525 = ATCC 6013]AOZ80299.1 SAM-dependent methyltransferase [Clostridium pasteurianum]ELP58346.1 sam-dependent methyltransferas